MLRTLTGICLVLVKRRERDVSSDSRMPSLVGYGCCDWIGVRER